MARAYILWDNITRGTQISCPHIERSCTAAFYADRKLGVSEMVATAASAIHIFTGNNIAPKGDLASRSLHIRLAVDRPTRKTEPSSTRTRSGGPDDNRAEILAGLLHDPARQPDAQGAARCAMPNPIQDVVAHRSDRPLSTPPNSMAKPSISRSCSSKQRRTRKNQLARRGAEGDERRQWLGTFKAIDVADLINDDQTNPHSQILRAFLFGEQPPAFRASAQWRRQKTEAICR